MADWPPVLIVLLLVAAPFLFTWWRKRSRVAAARGLEANVQPLAAGIQASRAADEARATAIAAAMEDQTQRLLDKYLGLDLPALYEARSRLNGEHAAVQEEMRTVSEHTAHWRAEYVVQIAGAPTDGLDRAGEAESQSVDEGMRRLATARVRQNAIQNQLALIDHVIAMKSTDGCTNPRA